IAAAFQAATGHKPESGTDRDPARRTTLLLQPTRQAAKLWLYSLFFLIVFVLLIKAFINYPRPCKVADHTSRAPGSRQFPLTRLRRMRKDEFSRRLMRETRLSTDDLIYPMFIVEGSHQRQEIASMPDIFRLSVDEL